MAPALVVGSTRMAPTRVTMATVTTNQGRQRTATEYRHRPYTSRPPGRYTAEESDLGPMTTAVQPTASADSAQAEAGNRVRSTTGRLIASANSSRVSVPNGWPCRPFCVSSQESVVARQMIPISRSARTTRSNRPRRSRGERGNGGSVTPPATIAVTVALRRCTVPELMSPA